MKSIELKKNWILMYYESGENKKDIRLKTEVPATVFEILLENGVINDPFYGLNEDKVDWVYNSDWKYESYFDISEDLLNYHNIKLKFYGLDTISDIYLNGHHLGRTDNMFRIYEFNIKKIIKKNDNKLELIFKSPAKYALSEIKKHGHPLYITSLGLPGINYLRKAQYSFGWDWGPKLPDIGIWRPVEIVGYNEIRIIDTYISQNFYYNKDPLKINNPKEIETIKVLKVDLKVEIELEISIFSDINKEKKISKYKAEIILKDPEGGQINKQQNITRSSLQEVFTINEPILWWVNGLGEPKQYDLQIFLKIDDEIIEKKELKIGIRDIKLIKNKDQWGESFYFMLNGIPLFIKGANWVPIDNFLVRGKKLELYEKLIESAKLININMLRVWGGGIYEDDRFYSLCDKLGILVWQDFMFACGIYPCESEFIENIKEEAIQNIRRIRNHPCLALWCGNNEIEWFLGVNLLLLFKIKFKFKKAEAYKRAYKYIFEDLFPSLIKKYDWQHEYWPSSPSNGSMFSDKKINSGLLNSNDPSRGDAHYWDVWHRGKPFSAYRKFIPRFMSEFGFQSFPSIKTIANFCPPDQFDFFSPIMKNHQKNQGSFIIFSGGNKKVMKYTKRRFNIPNNFEKQVILSQITQAEAIEYGVENWRINRLNNHCMGTIYWQLNDCWPVISWSSIDYYCRWKALHYIAKRFFQPLIATVIESVNRVKFNIINDYKNTKKGVIRWTIQDINGNINLRGEKDFTVLPCTSIEIDEINLDKKIQKIIKKSIIFYRLYNKKNELIFKGFRLFTAPKNLKLKNPNLTWEIKKINDKKFELSIKSQEIALYINIRSNKFDFIASDNYFSLNKGENCKIILNLNNKLTMDELISNINVESLFELMND
ncbi:MAG: glycosyl hydrolase 2 galactose-binding domain-containing protein [Candidatus Helarchaeota archaeon]